MNVTHPLTYNFYALALAICNELYDVEKAVNKFSPQVRNTSITCLTDADTERMIKLKETKTYKEIGLMFGVSGYVVFNRTKRYKQKRGSA